MRVLVVVKRFRDHFTLAALLVFGVFILAGCGDCETILLIEQPTDSQHNPNTGFS